MATDPSSDAAAAAPGGLTFGPGWDRQDRWLRFVDPDLERAYRDAVTVPTRRRFRIAAAVGCLVVAPQPLWVADVVDTSPGSALIVATFISILTMLAAMIWAGRAELRGIWGLSFIVFTVSAIGGVAGAVEVGMFLHVYALGVAVVGIFGIAWVRVAWWVAAAMCIAGVIVFEAAATATGGGSLAATQGALLAAALGAATIGSWFLESAERRSFSQGLLVEHLFRSYLSPDVAEALVADPGRAELGGEVVEVSVLFADLRGYTPFSEGRAPAEVVAMLNSAFGSAVPAVFAEGGTIVSFVGDALMAIFNAPLRQPDHALRACRAALALQHATLVDEDTAGRPRFRVGVNTGPALVGNIGSAELRNFSALGDTTNTAARLQTFAPEGSVVIGERTRELVGDSVEVRSLGAVGLKGKSSPTSVYELLDLRSAEATAAAPGRTAVVPV